MFYKSQVLLFIRGAGKNFDVADVVASVHSIHGTTSGTDILKEVENSFVFSKTYASTLHHASRCMVSVLSIYRV